MKRILAFGAGMMLLAFGPVSLAFEEQKLNTGKGNAAQGERRGGQIVPGQELKLVTPDVAPPRASSGTKIRVPGLGVIGEIPKMDFGLELLYGASQPKHLDSDRTEANGVMGRVTVPIKPPR
jgi:hypothetical protein